MPDRRVGAAMVATATIAAVGCSTAVESPAIGGSADVHTSPPLVQALCRVEDPTTGPEAIRDAFEDAHGALHKLAAEVAEVDRELAGRLHVAKHTAEMGLRSDEATARRRSAELLVVVQEALRALDRDAGACQSST